MTDEKTSNDGATITFDNWRTISFAVFLALVGYSVMVTVPVLSTALVESLSFSEEQVGRVWGNDMLGFSLGAIIAALSVARVNRRYLVMGGIVFSMGANAWCMYVADYESMMWLRFAAGIGSGIFTGTAVATLGGTTNPVRAFNILLLGFSFSAAGELHLFPQLSLNGIYWFLIGTAALCGLFLRWLPSRPLSVEEKQVQHDLKIIQKTGVCRSSYRSFASLPYASPTSISAVTSPISNWPHWTQVFRPTMSRHY